jgi:adenylate cyclase
MAIARTADPATLGFVTAWKYGLPIFSGVARVDDTALGDMDNALQIAEACGDNNVVCSVKYVLGTALLFRGSATDRQRGRELLAHARDMCLKHQFPRSELPLIDL